MLKEELLTLLNSEENAILWAEANGLICANRICDACNEPMKLLIQKKTFKCYKYKCQKTKKLYTDSIFKNSKLSLKKLILMLYGWCENESIEYCQKQLKLSKSTVSNWYKKFRKLACLFYLLLENKPIGGLNKTVEIDECCIAKRKYNTGRILRSQQWIFGGITREEPKEFFIEMVKSRNRQTLLEIIKRKILPETTIISDCWRAYNNLEILCPEYNFKHFQINHSENYVSPSNSIIHTQNIESFWSTLKRYLRSKGTNYISNIESHFGNFLYRKKYKDNLFIFFIEHIKLYY